MYKLQNSFLVFFVIFLILGFLYTTGQGTRRPTSPFGQAVRARPNRELKLQDADFANYHGTHAI